MSVPGAAESVSAASFQILVPEVPVLLGCSITASLVRLCTPNASYIFKRKQVYRKHIHIYTWVCIHLSGCLSTTRINQWYNSVLTVKLMVQVAVDSTESALSLLNQTQQHLIHGSSVNSSMQSKHRGSFCCQS